MSGSGATETQNIAVVRRGYEAFAKGDIEALKTLFAESANWHAVGAGVLPGNYRGAQAILGFFGQIAHETHGTTRVEPVTIAASGNNVFVLQRITGTRNGKTLDTKGVLLFTVTNEIVTEVVEFTSDYPAVAHFWS
jgi:ketosteroid isomerase-like protein